MTYSISDLEQLSGIQSHTIRIWEQRYNALQPMRSPGNTRFYDDNQLRRLLNIVTLSQSGMKISEVCALSDDDIHGLLNKGADKTLSDNARFEYYISQLINQGIAYNEFAFDKMLSGCIKHFGMINCYKNIIYPLLVRLGLMWGKDDICPAQEHFLSNIIRQKLFAAINGIPVKNNSRSSWLLFLPEDEEHDIGLLFAKYILRAYGQKVIYLGAKVPFGSLKEVMEQNKVDNMLLFIVCSRPVHHLQANINNLADAFRNVQIHLSGNSKLISEIKLGPNINWFKDIEQFECKIEKI